LDYDHYMTATTVDEFFSRKGNWGHLKYDVQCGAVSLIVFVRGRVDGVDVAIRESTHLARAAAVS